MDHFWVLPFKRDGPLYLVRLPGRLEGLAVVPGHPGVRIVTDLGRMAQELVKLGWEALPALIEHLDDPKPTRVECFRTGHHGVFPSWLLSVGDCCEIVYDAITGFRHYGWETASYDREKKGKTAEVKAEAEAGWKEHGAKGAAQHFLPLLKSGKNVPFAARGLLEADRPAHLPRIIRLAETSDWKVRRSVFFVLYPHLGREHRGFLEAFLEDPEDSYEVTFAARALWEKCGDDDGVRRVIARVDKLVPPRGEGGTAPEDAPPTEAEDTIFGEKL